MTVAAVVGAVVRGMAVVVVELVVVSGGGRADDAAGNRPAKLTQIAVKLVVVVC